MPCYLIMCKRQFVAASAFKWDTGILGMVYGCPVLQGKLLYSLSPLLFVAMKKSFHRPMSNV